MYIFTKNLIITYNIYILALHTGQIRVLVTQIYIAVNYIYRTISTNGTLYNIQLQPIKYHNQLTMSGTLANMSSMSRYLYIFPFILKS